MAMNVTSFTGNGLRDWLIQRISAIILALCSVFMIWHLVVGGSSYSYWHLLFSKMSVKIFMLLSLWSLIVHSWIGVWTISTDYIKPLSVRLTFQITMILALLIYLVWGIWIIWGMH